MNKKWWILIILIALVAAGVIKVNSVKAERKEKTLKEVTSKAIEKYGYNSDRYKFELVDSKENFTSILKITSVVNNKSWNLEYSHITNGGSFILDDFTKDTEQMESAIRIFLDSLRTHGFFPEVEKVKLREIANDYNIKYPKQKFEIKQLGVR